MKRTLLILTLLALTPQVQASEFWSGLWRTADQQGEALMQQGDAAAAAKVYTDPHRRAYAKLHAGDYQGAAKDLSELHDSAADYNRGNALAHAGDLQGALEAYDAALKSNPKNKDAKHNRELVAKALKQQPPSEQQKSDDKKQQEEKKDEQQNKDTPDSGGKEGQGKQENKQDGKEGQGKNEQDSSKQADSKSAKGQNLSYYNSIGK